MKGTLVSDSHVELSLLEFQLVKYRSDRMDPNLGQLVKPRIGPDRISWIFVTKRDHDLFPRPRNLASRRGRLLNVCLPLQPQLRPRICRSQCPTVLRWRCLWPLRPPYKRFPILRVLGAMGAPPALDLASVFFASGKRCKELPRLELSRLVGHEGLTLAMVRILGPRFWRLPSTTRMLPAVAGTYVSGNPEGGGHAALWCCTSSTFNSSATCYPNRSPMEEHRVIPLG